MVAFQLAGRSLLDKCWTQHPRHQRAMRRPGKRRSIFTDLMPAITNQTDICPAKMWRKGHGTQRSAAVHIRTLLLNVWLHQLWLQRTWSCWTATDGNISLFPFKPGFASFIYIFQDCFHSFLSHNRHDKKLPLKTNMAWLYAWVHW